jgi:molecular chaperone GrpE
MIADRKGRKPNRIPVRFMDEETAKAQMAGEADEPGRDLDRSGLSNEELGRASSYEDATEMQRRIDRGAEEGGARGHERADDADTAGGPATDDLPERREDQDEAQSDSQPSASAIREEDETDSPQLAGGLASGPMLAELIATRAELKRVEAERADLLDKLARRQADFENYRKRVERERGDTYNRIAADVAGKLLPVMDNLRRALDAEASLQAGESEEFRHFLNGVELISKQLNDVLESLGVQPVPAVGEPFDPHVHEAIATEQTDDYEPDTVMQEIVRGYRLGEKLLRPAMVKVATK